MLNSMPQWVTDIESDESIFKKKRSYFRIIFFSLVVIYFIVGFVLLSNSPTYFSLFGVVIAVIFTILLVINAGIKKTNLANLLAANLYSIGAELETFDATSPSYLMRNKQYLTNCQGILNKLIISDGYFVENHNKFLKNLEHIILCLNYCYLQNSKPTNFSYISGDLKALAESIHEDYKNLKPVHTEYVDGVLSNLQNVEPLALETHFVIGMYNSINTAWYNKSYSYRATFTFLIIGIVISAALSIVMIYFLNMGKSESIGYALVGTLTFLGGLITQIDKIVPKEKIKLS